LIVVVAFLFFSWLVPDKQRPDWDHRRQVPDGPAGNRDWLMSLLPDDPENTIYKEIQEE